MKEFYAYVIYQNPADYPYKVVIRKFRCEEGNAYPIEVYALCDTLSQARKCLPKFLAHQIPREPKDVPSLIETWI